MIIYLCLVFFLVPLLEENVMDIMGIKSEELKEIFM